MDDQQLYDLLKKFNQGQCNAAELQTLEQWYARLGPDRPAQLLVPGSAQANAITAQQLQALRTAMGTGLRNVAPMPRWKRAARYAAVWGGLALLGAGSYYGWQRTHTPGDKVVAAQQNDINRFVQLPDGSRVVLHTGSQLKYPEHFSGDTRAVTLVGEAYFDIAPQAGSQFVIHTGRLTTTVLGTAFNISAYPDRITVSVTHGKVKVEEARKLLAVLTPDQQMVYHTQNASAEQRAVNAEDQRSWTNDGMVFEDVSFATIAHTLGQRYGVAIYFSNDALEACPIRAAFNGTETLQQVLEVLCAVRNATYEIRDNNTVVISGAGCSL